MTRAYIIIQDGRVPLTPLDECWSEDGHVYVRFAQSKNEDAVLVGTLSNPALVGRRNVTVIVPHPQEVLVDVDGPLTSRRSNKSMD